MTFTHNITHDLVSSSQHFQGLESKNLMKIFSRYSLNAIAANSSYHTAGTPAAPLEEPEEGDTPLMTKLQKMPMFIKSTRQYPSIYVLTTDNKKHHLPDYDTYLHLLGSNNTLFDNIPRDVVDFFPVGEPMKSVNAKR